MRRQIKYPNTQVFTYNNVNPKNKLTGDCVYRTLSLAMNKPYNEVVMELAKFHCETGYQPTCEYGKFLEKNGWIKFKQPRKLDNTKYTGEEYCKSLQASNINKLPNIEYDYSRIICNIGEHHVTCIINGKINDIWNCSHKRVGNIYIRKITQGDN